MITLLDLLKLSNDGMVFCVYASHDSTSDIASLDVGKYADNQYRVYGDKLEVLSVIMYDLYNAPVHCLVANDGCCVADIYLEDMNVDELAELKREVKEMYEEYPECRNILSSWYNNFKEDM